MSRVPIAAIPYNTVQFEWISNHWDVHLTGTCIYNSELCEFENDYPDYDVEKDEWKEMTVRIYKLDILEKISWRKRQYLFERRIGYFWTYPQRKEGKGFILRRPKWFYRLLFKWHYKSCDRKQNK